MDPSTQQGTIYKIHYSVDTGGRLLVRLLGRDTAGQRINRAISGCVPYFYIESALANVARTYPEVVSVEPGPKATDGSLTARVNVQYPFQVPEVKKRFGRTWEADVIFANRVRIDHNLTHVTVPGQPGVLPVETVTPLSEAPAVTPRILDFDIEVDDVDGYAEPENPRNAVTAISLFDSQKKQYGFLYSGPRIDPDAVMARLHEEFARAPEKERDYEPTKEQVRFFPCDDERALLGSFGALLQKIEPDVTNTWNGYNYDYPYLSGRVQRLAPSINNDHRLLYDSFSDDNRSRGWFALCDSMAIFRKQEMRQRELSLETVAQELLGFGKVKRPDSVTQMRRDDPVGWAAYAIMDTHLTRRIREVRDLVPWLFSIAFLAGVEAQDCEFNSRIIDGVLFREARASGKVEICLPSKVHEDREEEEARAALVFQPEIGLHQWVGVVDLAQTYPSIERTLNISPETYVPSAIPGQTYDIPGYGSFLREPMGILPRALNKLVSLRGALKEKARLLPPGSMEKKIAETTSQGTKYVVNCAAKGTLVATVRGPKEIENIAAGEAVFCYTDNGPVATTTKGAVLSGVKEVYEVKTRLRNITVTKNHPFLAVVCPGKKLNHTHTLEWKPLEELAPGSLVVISNKLPVTGKSHVLPDGSETDIDFCRFLGCFAGDGYIIHRTNPTRLGRVRSTGHYGKGLCGNQFGTFHAGEPMKSEYLSVQLALFGRERSQYAELVRRRFGYNARPEKNVASGLNVGGDKFARLLITIGLDHPAHEKVFPEWVFELPVDQMKALIDGLVDSDGWVSNGPKESWAIISTSKRLLDQVRFLCYSVGYRVSAVRRVKPQNPKKVALNKRGVPILQRHPAYTIGIYPNNPPAKTPGVMYQPCASAVARLVPLLPEGFELKAIQSITPKGSVETYDIEVADHHNFIAEGMVVHNSATGVFKEKHWRLRNTNAFGCVTAVGRMQLQWNRQHIEDPVWLSSVLGAGYSGKVIMGHTDSCWYKLYRNGEQVLDYDLVVGASQKLTSALNATYPEFMVQFGQREFNYTSVDLEGVAEVHRILPKADSTEGAKTRYYCVFAYKDGKDLRALPFAARKKIMGVEIRRFNNALITKQAQERVIELVCTGNSQDVPRYYERLEDECVVQGIRDDDMLIPGRLGEGYAEGRKPPAWVTAAQNLRDLAHMPVRVGDVVRWGYVDEVIYQGVHSRPPEGVFGIPYRSNLAEMAHKGLTVRLRRREMFEKTVKRPMELVMPELFGGTMGEEVY